MKSWVRSANSAWRRSLSWASVMMSMSKPVSWRREAHVLAAAADGERELLVGHHDLDALDVVVEDDLGDLGRLQRVDEEGRRVLVPGDDVDLLALELGDHGLHAGAAHADAGADRVDRAVVGDDAHLGAASRGRGRPP